MTSINQAAATDQAQHRGEQHATDQYDAATEQTPLLPPADAEAQPDQSQPHRDVSARRALLSSLHPTAKGSQRRWPSILALLLLSLLVLLVMVFAFLAPSTVAQYAQQAVVFEPTSLSIASFTSSGVRARIQGDFRMDARRVERKAVRDLGRFFTYIAREAESGASEVEVSLPEYGNVVLGTARIPAIKVYLRNGHRTHVDFLSDLAPGDVDGIRRIANDWIDGRLGEVRVLGKASVPVKSGIFSLGKQKLQQEMLFANKDIPSMPRYDIEKLNFREMDLPHGGRGMAADVALRVQNHYPVDFTIPPLAFNILVAGCHEHDPFIKLADAETHPLHVQPKHTVDLNVTGLVHQLPEALTQDCPDSHKSPLDLLLGKYIHGETNTLYVRGSSAPHPHTPHWLTALIADLTVPMPLPGRTFGHLIKNFSLADTHLGLPDPFAAPDTDHSNPRLSARVRALVALPQDLNFNLSVSRVRADADVFYRGAKLGELDLHKWQMANSTRVAASESEGDADGPMLMVECLIKDAPLRITDDEVFADVVRALVFGGRGVVMRIRAVVDVELTTALGGMVVRGVPAEGEVPVKPISGGNGNGNGNNGDINTSFRPRIFDLQILHTTRTSLTLTALVNLTNPTDYAASVPYLDILITTNGSVLGHATVRNLHLAPGENSFMPVTAVWDPAARGGAEGVGVGRELLSQYISGWNTTITLRMHEGSLPTQPALGRALARFGVELPTPRLQPPSRGGGGGDGDGDDDDGDGGAPHFIEDATMHLLTSTATFTLLSPLTHTILYITHINATAFYKGADVGHVFYELPFAVPPVDGEGRGTLTPRLPVEWSLGSVGYEAVRRALGGRLVLSARAVVGVGVGEWGERVWFEGGGIGAGVRL
ncbi:hypothetical protein LTR08_003407 [Meristemomyces frigidus]|nr:hypothetical protein LTR08_003407 [Meristemomyces frigidus]